VDLWEFDNIVQSVLCVGRKGGEVFIHRSLTSHFTSGLDLIKIPHLSKTKMTTRQKVYQKNSLGSLALRMELCNVQDGGVKGDLSKANLSQTTRRSSTGSSRSSLSPDEEKPRIMSRQMSLNEPNQRLNKDTLAKIGNRQIKVVSHKKNCASCLKPLLDDGFFALGQLFHKACFRCKFCSKKLGQKFLVKNSSACCCACYKEAKEVCTGCGDTISDDYISCDDKMFHPRCMKCQVCGEQVKDKYLTYNDLPICLKDFKRLGHVCSVCNEAIMDSVCMLDGVAMCEKDYQEMMGTWPCSSCGKDISPQGYGALKVGNVRFHQRCLECRVCHKNLEGKAVTLDKENRVYCTEDYNRHFGNMCATCKKAIVPKKGQTKAPRIRALGKDFHVACFKCEDCGLVLDTGVKGKECWPVRSHTLCYGCYRRRQSESEQESD